MLAAMDVVGEGARAAASAAAGAGFMQSVVGFSARLHAPPLLAPHRRARRRHPPRLRLHVPLLLPKRRRKEDGDDEAAPPRRRRGFHAGELDEEPDRHNDRVLQMMRSFSFVHASEEDFVDGMATYGRAFDDAPAPTEPLVPRAEPPPAPDSPPALIFSFRNQVPEIPREAPAVVSRAVPVQVEKESPVPFITVDKHEREAEETEVLMEDEDE